MHQMVLPLELDVYRNGTIFKSILSPEKRPIENQDGSFSETLRIGIIGGVCFRATKNYT